MYEFEEKEQYTLEEVQDIVNGIKTEVEEAITEKDTTITDLQGQIEGIGEMQKQNHDLQVQNLAIKNGLDEDMLDLVYDEDLEKVEQKIEKLQELSKKQKIDGGYKPSPKREDDAYEKAIDSGDVQGAIKNKLGKLFE